MTAQARAELARQAEKAGHENASTYLRTLATRDRTALGLPQFDYNSGVT